MADEDQPQDDDIVTITPFHYVSKRCRYVDENGARCKQYIQGRPFETEEDEIPTNMTYKQLAVYAESIGVSAFIDPSDPKSKRKPQKKLLEEVMEVAPRRISHSELLNLAKRVGVDTTTTLDREVVIDNIRNAMQKTLESLPGLTRKNLTKKVRELIDADPEFLVEEEWVEFLNYAAALSKKSGREDDIERVARFLGCEDSEVREVVEDLREGLSQGNIPQLTLPLGEIFPEFSRKLKTTEVIELVASELGKIDLETSSTAVLKDLAVKFGAVYEKENDPYDIIESIYQIRGRWPKINYVDDEDVDEEDEEGEPASGKKREENITKRRRRGKKTVLLKCCAKHAPECATLNPIDVHYLLHQRCACVDENGDRCPNYVKVIYDDDLGEIPRFCHSHKSTETAEGICSSYDYKGLYKYFKQCPITTSRGGMCENFIGVNDRVCWTHRNAETRYPAVIGKETELRIVVQEDDRVLVSSMVTAELFETDMLDEEWSPEGETQLLVPQKQTKTATTYGSSKFLEDTSIDETIQALDKLRSKIIKKSLKLSKPELITYLQDKLNFFPDPELSQDEITNSFLETVQTPGWWYDSLSKNRNEAISRLTTVCASLGVPPPYIDVQDYPLPVLLESQGDKEVWFPRTRREKLEMQRAKEFLKKVSDGTATFTEVPVTLSGDDFPVEVFKTLSQPSTEIHPVLKIRATSLLKDVLKGMNISAGTSTVVKSAAPRLTEGELHLLQQPKMTKEEYLESMFNSYIRELEEAAFLKRNDGYISQRAQQIRRELTSPESLVLFLADTYGVDNSGVFDFDTIPLHVFLTRLEERDPPVHLRYFVSSLQKNIVKQLYSQKDTVTGDELATVISRGVNVYLSSPEQLGISTTSDDDNSARQLVESELLLEQQSIEELSTRKRKEIYKENAVRWSGLYEEYLSAYTAAERKKELYDQHLSNISKIKEKKPVDMNSLDYVQLKELARSYEVPVSESVSREEVLEDLQFKYGKRYTAYGFNDMPDEVLFRVSSQHGIPTSRDRSSYDIIRDILAINPRADSGGDVLGFVEYVERWEELVKRCRGSIEFLLEGWILPYLMLTYPFEKGTFHYRLLNKDITLLETIAPTLEERVRKMLPELSNSPSEREGAIREIEKMLRFKVRKCVDGWLAWNLGSKYTPSSLTIYQSSFLWDRILEVCGSTIKVVNGVPQYRKITSKVVDGVKETVYDYIYEPVNPKNIIIEHTPSGEFRCHSLPIILRYLRNHRDIFEMGGVPEQSEYGEDFISKMYERYKSRLDEVAPEEMWRGKHIHSEKVSEEEVERDFVEYPEYKQGNSSVREWMRSQGLSSGVNVLIVSKKDAKKKEKMISKFRGDIGGKNIEVKGAGVGQKEFKRTLASGTEVYRNVRLVGDTLAWD